MSQDFGATAPVAASACPESGAGGTPVARQTVAALVRGRVPPRQDFWLCRDPSCPVIYFGSEAAIYEVEDLVSAPGYKEGSDGLLCYCFLVRERDIAREIEETGASYALERITEEVKAGNCACEVRNPSGKCCLSDVQHALDRLAASD